MTDTHAMEGSHNGCGCSRCAQAGNAAPPSDKLARAVAEAFKGESPDATEPLDQLVEEAASENWPPLIERLADQTLSTALRHAQNRAEAELDFEVDFDFEAAHPPGKVTLPGAFDGWKGAISLAELFGPRPPELFTTPSKPNEYGLLYRVYEEFKQYPLYIGMAFRSNIRDRVQSHLRGVITKSGKSAKTQQVKSLQHLQTKIDSVKSEIEKLRILAADPKLGLIKVQYGKVKTDDGSRMTPKFLHAYEAALQVKEKPHSYVGSVWTFEDIV